VKELLIRLKELKEKFEKDGNEKDAKTISDTLINIDNLLYDVMMYNQWYEEGKNIIKKVEVEKDGRLG
jgi:hypothetical protein